jgi:hypothetical protein
MQNCQAWLLKEVSSIYRPIYPENKVPSGIPQGAAGLTFGEGTVAGVFMEARHII